MLTMNHPVRHDAHLVTPPQPLRVSNKRVAPGLTFLMVVGPGLIVMEGDDDAARA